MEKESYLLIELFFDTLDHREEGKLVNLVKNTSGLSAREYLENIKNTLNTPKLLIEFVNSMFDNHHDIILDITDDLSNESCQGVDYLPFDSNYLYLNKCSIVLPINIINVVDSVWMFRVTELDA